jgi:hypothetical protein
METTLELYREHKRFAPPIEIDDIMTEEYKSMKYEFNSFAGINESLEEEVPTGLEGKQEKDD